MTIRVAGSAEASEPGDFWYPADSSSSEDQLNAKVDGLFQSLTRGGAFEMKVGLGEATVQKHALSAFYHANKDNETIVDPSGKLKVIIQLTGTQPAPPVQVVPTAPADAPGENGRKKKFGEQGMWTNCLTQLQSLCDNHMKCDDQGTFLSFRQQDVRTMNAVANRMIAEAKLLHGEGSNFPVMLTNFWMVKIKDKIKNSKTRADKSKNVAIAAKNERDASAMQQAQQINTAPNTLLLSNMPNQTNASAVVAVQQQAIAAMNTLVTSNTSTDDDSGGNLDDGNDINPSDGSPGMEMEEDEGVFDEDDHDDDAFPTVHEATAEDPPHGDAIDINQLLDDATVLANATATANARTATTRTIVDEKTAFREQVTNVTTKFAMTSQEWKDMAADTLTAVTPEDASWYNANKDTVTKKLMDALAHLERDEGTINFVAKDAGVILGMIPPDKVSVPTLLKSSTSDPSSVP